MMGIKLVQAAYAWWPKMPDRPFRLLVHMCITAKDTDENPRFYGDRALMILALGLDPELKTSDQMVSRAIRHLLDEGAILRATNARFGKRAEYWVRVGKSRPKVDSTVKQDLTPESTNCLTPQSKEVDSSGKQRLTPESTQGVTKGLQAENREESTSTRRPSTRATGRVATADESRLQLLRERADREAAS